MLNGNVRIGYASTENMTIVMGYIWNCIWLTAPILLLNVLLMNRLPKAYQPEVFWHDIPAWLRVGENTFRTAIFVLPILMPLRVIRSGQATGLVLYAVGLILYFFSWSLQVWYPETRWSASRWGFMAPSYTPLIWLVGIALIGDSLYVPIPYSPWVYVALSVAFLTFHNLHVWIVYSRTR
jgi:hypothetical protein